MLAEEIVRQGSVADQREGVGGQARARIRVLAHFGLREAAARAA